MRRLLFALSTLVACGDDAPRPTGPTDAHVDAPYDAEACGVRGAARGTSRRMVSAGGLDRTYIVHLPPGDPATPMPLVFVMHGYTMSGQAMVDVTEFEALADREHFAVVFPDGQAGPDSQGAPWNVGRGVCPSYFGDPPNGLTGDDFAFVDAMKADVSRDQCLDREHVFMTGFSMGGYFSHHANCLRPDIRAAAPASGGTHDLAGCLDTPKPILILHGSSDELIPAGCDDPSAPPVAGVVPSATAWAIHNGCSSTQTTKTTVQNGTCEAFDGCPEGGQVTICRFANMGHCWAGGPQSLYGCPGYASASQLVWDFFKQHAW